jgi:hypothetical protein
MASAKDVEVTAPQTVGFTDLDNVQWKNVHTEQPDQITFDTIGDTLIAVYLGRSVIRYTEVDKKTGEEIPREFTQLRFMLPGNNPAVVNGGWDLLKAYEDVPENHLTRTQYLKDVDVDQQSPMKSYRVDVGPDMSDQLQ